MRNKIILLTTLVVSVSGCASFTGLDAKSDFACSAPVGVSCDSMGGVYANMGKNNTQPSSKASKDKKDNFSYLGGVNYAERSKVGADEYGRRPITYGENSGIPIRTQPQVMKIWVAPWQSNDKTFYDQTVAYIVVDYGDWVLAHNKNNIIDEYAPYTAPVYRADVSDRVIEIPKIDKKLASYDEVQDDMSKSSEDGGEVRKIVNKGFSSAKTPEELAMEIAIGSEEYGNKVSEKINDNLLNSYSKEANGK